MPLDDRVNMIKEIQELRKSTVICYLTSLRGNVAGAMADDSVRVVLEHLKKIDGPPIERLDLFLCSNGGSGTVPWRFVSLFREFAKSFYVLVPYRAYSAATLVALGADEIVMHPFAELGPIDPTVSNVFNPVDPQSQQRLGISVEDVKSYVSFIKQTVGIRHEDELIEAIKILAQNVHPLALGNVERFLSQTRLIARKLLETHNERLDPHAIEDIIENMASKLYFHGHPISRAEARDELRLKVAEGVPARLEEVMWRLYLDYEQEFKNAEEFHPEAELASLRLQAQAALAAQPAAAPPTPPQQAGPPGLAQMAAAMAAAAAAPPVATEHEHTHVMVECATLSSRFTSKHRYELLAGGPGQRAISDELIALGWSHSSVQ